MSRPLTGSKAQTGTGWSASLPKTRGSTRRTAWTFTSEAAADRWLNDGKAALAEGRALPVPVDTDLAATRRRPGRGSGTPFGVMADLWLQERYEEIRMGGVDRATKLPGATASDGETTYRAVGGARFRDQRRSARLLQRPHHVHCAGW